MEIKVESIVGYEGRLEKEMSKKEGKKRKMIDK